MRPSISLSRQSLALAIAAMAAIVVLVVLLGFEWVPGLRIVNLSVEDVQRFAEAWAPWSAIASIGLMVVHSFVPLPAEIIAVANGVMFGFLGGVLVTWTGAMLGAILSFAIGRSFGRPALRWLVPERRWRMIEGWEFRPSALLLARLLPVISFNLINYGAGLARVRWWPFLWTTGIGILPLTMASVLLGNSIVRVGWYLGAIVIACGALLWVVLRRQSVQQMVDRFFIAPSQRDEAAPTDKVRTGRGKCGGK